MVGIRKKVSWSRWSMVNYQHFDCVKKKEREKEQTGDIQHYRCVSAMVVPWMGPL